MAKLIPILRYRCPAEAMAWLVEALGFARHYVAEDEGRIVHAQLRLGEAMIMIGPDDPDDRYGMHSPLALNGTNQCVYIVLDSDVDAACRRVAEARGEIVTAPYDTAYGSREFTCRDPEGHLWSIGSYSGEPAGS